MQLEGTREYKMDFAGRQLTMEFGHMARLAGGSVVVRYGDTVILATACVSDAPRDLNFLPFRVDYEERQYAIGKIPGSFFRREGRPSERAILTCRLIDRPFRPLFPSGYRNDIQVIITVLSYDPDHSSEVCAILGASLALGISSIPIHEVVTAVSVGLVDGEIVLNPSAEQMDTSTLELMVAGTEEAVVMVEAGGDEVPEEIVLDAILQGHEEIKKVARKQKEIIAELGVPKEEFEEELVPEELDRAVRELATEDVRQMMSVVDKQERGDTRSGIREKVQEALEERFPDEQDQIKSILKDIEKEEMRKTILTEGRRADGRQPDEIRKVTSEVGFLPRAHGSGLFTRGETQVLTVTALGPVGDRQRMDTLQNQEELKRFMHHYNFPPYSTGESWPLRGPGRREIGHGALAEKALRPVLPPEDKFPYTLRLVSEVLASNGSSSMAAICGSTLSLMDAGVPISSPVAGVAMGLIIEGDDVAILSDILGLEDQLGDMDFKVAGTEHGINAIQMDIKTHGVTREVLRKALDQARGGRLFILDRMKEAIAEPRAEMSKYAPRIFTMKVDPSKIRHIIGPGGKTINAIIDDYGVSIDVEDDGTVYIASEGGEGAAGAQERIHQLTADAEVGKIYKGTVKRIVDKLGAFVEILPNKDGLVHISNLTPSFVDDVESVLSVGDEIMVKLVEVDDLGRLNLSRKVVISELGQEKVDSMEKRTPGGGKKSDQKKSQDNRRGRRRR